MSVREVLDRSRQELSKWRERASVSSSIGREPDSMSPEMAARRVLAMVRKWVPAAQGEAGALLDRFKEDGPRRFFAGAESMRTPTLLIEHVPDARDQAVVHADALCRGRFDLLGYRALDFGDPIDWHLEATSRRRVPAVHWSLIDPLDPLLGDVKVIWELNRHQWIVHLAQAYRLTGDERYAEAAADAVRDWIFANPPGIGINWASSLEAALRLIAWCWMLVLLRQSRALSPELFVQMLAGIAAHAAHIEKYLSSYHSPNTHLTGEALGLFYAGVLFPELAPAARWYALAQAILCDEIHRQVFSDGVYFEQSTCYQRYTVDIYLHFMLLAARNALRVPRLIAERVQQMVDFLLSVRRPDGSVPAIGDLDGGSLLPLGRRSPGDFGDVFSTAAAVFRRPDYAWAAGGVAQETIWLLGDDALGAFAQTPAAPPELRALRVFPEGGYAIMRSGWEPASHHLIFDVGPLGCPISGGHGHADLLSVQCSAFGQPISIDPGTYCYARDPEWRSFCRSSVAHSTIRVDDVDQAVPAGPFAWERRPRARLRRWLSTDLFDLADAEHDGYARLSDPVVHRRQVLFVRHAYWLLVDDLAGDAEHHVELRFQFAPMRLEVDASLWARAHGGERCGLWIRPFAAVPLHAHVIEGETARIDGWICPDYARRQPAPALTYTTTTMLPLRVLTLLYPAADSTGEVPRVSCLSDDNAVPAGLLFTDTGERIRIDGCEPHVDHS